MKNKSQVHLSELLFFNFSLHITYKQLLMVESHL